MLFLPIAALGLPSGHFLATFGAFPTVAAARQSPATTLFASQSIFINNRFLGAVLLVMVVLFLSLSLPNCCTYRAELAHGCQSPTTTTTCNVLLRYLLRQSCRPLEAERLEQIKAVLLVFVSAPMVLA